MTGSWFIRWKIIPAIFSISLWLVLFNFSLATNQPVFVWITILFVPGLLLLFYLFFDPDIFLYLVIFFVPLSIKIDLPGGFALSTPSELLMVLMVSYLFLHADNINIPDRKIFTHPISLLLAMEIAWLLISSLFSTMLLVSFKRTFITSLYILVFFFIFLLRFNKPGNIIKFYLFYCLGLIIPVIYGMIWHSQYNFSQPSSYIMPRPFFTEHAIYGAALAFVIPALLFISYNKGERFKNSWKKTLSVLLFILILTGEFLSYSRGAWLSLAVAMILFILFYFRIRMIYIVSMSAVIFLLVIMNFSQILTYMSRNEARSNRGNIKEQIQSVSNIQSDISNLERVNRWKCAIRMFRDKPLTGFGPGTYQFKYFAYQQRNEMTRISTIYGNKGNAHSEYLGTLAETGFPGFLLILSTVLFTIFTAVRIIYKSRNKFLRNLTIAIILGLTTFYIHGLFNGFLENDEIASLYYGSLAAITALDVYFFRKAI